MAMGQSRQNGITWNYILGLSHSEYGYVYFINSGAFFMAHVGFACQKPLGGELPLGRLQDGELPERAMAP